MEAAPPLRNSEDKSPPSRPQSRFQPPDNESEHQEAPGWYAVSRGTALFFGALALASVAAAMKQSGTEPDYWWIDLHPASADAARGYLALLGTLLIAFALRPIMSPLRRGITLSAVLLLFSAALWNAWGFYLELREETIQTTVAVPFALHLAAGLAVVFSGVVAVGWESDRPGRDLLVSTLAFGACAVAFPVAHIYCFGSIDHRRQSDAAIVFSERLGDRSEFSDAYAERLQTAYELYEQKLVGKVVLSLGSGDVADDEIESVRQIAIDRGIAESDLIIDAEAADAQSSISGTLKVCDEHSLTRVLAVGHFSQLPRIKLDCLRAGYDVATVPVGADDSPSNRSDWLGRETVALWTAFLRPLSSQP